MTGPKLCEGQHTETESWPPHWLPREVARTSRVVLIGSQRYHRLTVPFDDAGVRGRLVGIGYRAVQIYGDPQEPTRNRKVVYQRRVPDDGKDG